MAGSERHRPAGVGAVLLGVAAGLLVAADAVAALTARKVGSPSCSSTTHMSIGAPVLLAAGGFVVLMALVTRLATAGTAPRSPRPRWALFMTLWVVVVFALAVSAVVVYVAATFKLCV